MTETLAIEWAPFEINSNAGTPGMFETEMTEKYIARVGYRVGACFSRKRFGKPFTLNGSLLYLADSRSHFVNGACVITDGARITI